MEVKTEKYGFRDAWISQRHREWGATCAAADLDLVMVESNFGEPCGLVEYKHHRYKGWVDAKHPTYRALVSLANAANIPAIVAFYWPEQAAFPIQPLNQAGFDVFRAVVEGDDFYEEEIQSELTFVRGLYKMRSRMLAETMQGRLSTKIPGDGLCPGRNLRDLSV